MRQITKDIQITIEGNSIGFRLTKLDAFSGVTLLRLLMRLGEPPRAASGGNSVGGEVNRSERAPLRGVATTEVAGAGTHIPIICTTLKYQLVIVCYGPSCEEYASRIRAMLYLDGSGFPRKILRDAGIYPVPDPPQPVLLHEEEGSLWRKRADLTIQIRVRDEQRGQSRGSITTAVAVILH